MKLDFFNKIDAMKLGLRCMYKKLALSNISFYVGVICTKAIARRNKDSRTKLYFPHRTGGTSFKNIKRKIQLKDSLSQVPEEEQTETFKNNVWVEHRELDTRGHVRRVGKYTSVTQRHVPMNDRKAIIQEIKNHIVEEVRVKIL
ncbi:unnamed protein product [Coffea canephora]|uniref:DH200=94 genomic scaffold, scaffold_771 n=1 Tax=Coffea canephora TaxID=49390 RepID=A0A068VGE2_COFCA|nr:unnamed protein product [Coffea canephora]